MNDLILKTYINEFKKMKCKICIILQNKTKCYKDKVVDIMNMNNSFIYGNNHKATYNTKKGKIKK